MDSSNTIDRICGLFGHLSELKRNGVSFVSSRELAKAVGSTAYTVRKDFSKLNITGYSRRGYEVGSLKQKLGEKFALHQKHRACIVGLGRLGAALLDYENFQEDGFAIVAGFDSNVNKLERIQTPIDVFPVSALPEVVASRGIDLGIIAVPREAAQETADILCAAGVKGILNFAPAKINVPKRIVYRDMDFTSALRFIAARLSLKNR